MKILITGATGFVGKHLVPRLLAEGHECALLVRDVEKAHRIYPDNINIIQYQKCNFEYVSQIRGFNAEIVIHLATYYTTSDDVTELHDLLEANIEFTSYLCSAVEQSNIKYFINTRTFSEYYGGRGKYDPANLYSALKTSSKHIIEYFAEKQNYNVIHVYPYSIYGQNGTVKKIFDYLLDATFGNQHIEMTEGTQVFDFIHVDDVVDFYCNIVKNRHLIHQGVSEYHLGTGRGISIRELANIVEKISGIRPNIGWGKKPYRRRDIIHSVAPISDLKRDFNWEASISILEGMKKLIKSYRG